MSICRSVALVSFRRSLFASPRTGTLRTKASKRPDKIGARSQYTILESWQHSLDCWMPQIRSPQTWLVEAVFCRIYPWLHPRKKSVCFIIGEYLIGNPPTKETDWQCSENIHDRMLFHKNGGETDTHGDWCSSDFPSDALERLAIP